ncbi:tRNA threonylcarbamoyladenosine biosynthesis protein RimN [Pelagibaculum spongiae]|uniref:Threonylcarbamoyl-AMP synthase n=2 Tax=Pelagibaculum spongiae TaxID=2080658 RepID=A0A2V1GSR0_9GAMM|nr:Sua5/YciO/YrdC/YwlC family protein [Pelagibaculum spongiae]PVZ68429.1 tRNA threonylcarbamoyladenosine biosynthesis protein RimN [Pelagibaculum spongiae]
MPSRSALEWVASHHKFSIERAVAALYRGELIAYPTESVFGLGCNPFDEQAVEKLLQLKSRPVEKGLILIAASFEQVAPLIDVAKLSELQLQQIRQSGPMPVTWVMPVKPNVPHWLTGKFNTLAVRVTDHPVAAALCERFGGPLVSTSANPAGLPPAKNRLKVRKYFGNQLANIVIGELGKNNKPSEIRDAISGKVFRKG